MTDRPGRDPHHPGAATPPRFLAGREPQPARVPQLLRAAPQIPANLRLTGLRGVRKSVLLDISHRLDEEFHARRVDTLTPSEQDLLIASGDGTHPPLRTSDLRSPSDESEGNVNDLTGRPAEQGVIYRVQKGQHHDTAPKLHEYRRRVPTP